MARALLFILLIEVIGASGSFFTMPAIPTWYASLIKPPWNPPSWLFGPVWTLLFAMMGYSLHLVTLGGFKTPEVKRALLLFLVQMALNVAWSAVFFGQRSTLGGLYVIVPLVLLIAITARSFYSISRTAGLLLLPYLAWTSFAMVLNFTLWRLNR